MSSKKEARSDIKMPVPNGIQLYWPESHGFSIAGSGPCYVISVSRKSEAYKAGISPGDQLIEVANHNVTDMSAEAIKRLARHSSLQPPSISVVSKMQYIDLVADRRWGYGFAPKGVRPTVIGSVDPPGAAYLAGIRAGDIIIEVNGKELKHPKYLDPILQTKYGKITLGIVPMDGKFSKFIPIDHGRTETRTANHSTHADKHTGRVGKARDLFAKMNVLLGQNFQKKLTVVELLKKYSEDRHIDKFASALNRVLNTHQDRRLLNEIRPFIPVKQLEHFDQVLNFRSHGNNQHGSPSSQLNTLSISTGSQNSKYVNRHGHSIGGTGLLAIAKDLSKPRTVCVERASSGSFGFILRGHTPVYVESTVPRGPADKAGLKSGDQILKVNGIDVSKCSHDHLVKILQSSGEVTRLEVSRMPIKSKQEKVRAPQPISSPDSHRTASSWLSDSGLTLDGHSFKDKVEMLLTAKEKMSIRLALIEYNINRNIAQLVDDGNSILDTPAKRALWVFILNRLTKDHQNYVFKYVDIPKRYLQEIINNVSKLSKENTAEFLKSPANTTEMLSSDLTEVTDDTLHSANYHQGSFKKQLEYLLTSRERSQLQKALQIYRERKNVHHLLGDLSDILDTASKKTLWFYVLPLLESQHKSYVQRVLGLPDNVLKKDSLKKDSVHSHSKGVFPKYGDILYLQNEFVGNFLQSRRKLNGYSSDEDLDDLVPEHGDSVTSDVPNHTSSTLSSERLFNTMGYQKKTTLPLRGRFGQSAIQPTYSSDVEQSTLVLNPIYAEIDHSAKTSPEIDQRHVDVKPKTKMVRESAAQTTPKRTPIHHPRLLQQGASISYNNNNNTTHPDFKTVVRVYDQSQRQPDIVSVCDTRARHNGEANKFSLNNRISQHGNQEYYEEPVSTGTQYTNLDDVNLNGYQLKEPFYHTLDSPQQNRYQIGGNSHNDQSINDISNHKNSQLLDNAMGTPSFSTADHSHHKLNQLPVNANNLRSVSKLYSQQQTNSNGNASPFAHSVGENNVHSTDSGGSLHRGDSYHTKAMNAIKELDNVVDNENCGSLEPDDIEREEDHLPHSSYATKPLAVAPPPPPLPESSNGDIQTKSSVRLNVKRINWEKIDQPQENTIWSKIDKDSDDLKDVVKYLELEQQFSTKTTKASQSFMERKTENYILSPKKAYNISILLGHLKIPGTNVRQALLTMNGMILTPDLLRQIIAYMPDKKEQGQYSSYSGSMEELSKPDQFMYQLSSVPGYEQRLQAMLFKANFAEKVEELRKNISCIRKSTRELEESSTLSKILELVLAMGNYMNKGSNRVGQAAAFRIHFLQNLDLTKTSNGKGSFLTVLTNAVTTRYPMLPTLSETLPHIHQAAKVSGEPVQGELSELRKVLQEISTTVAELSGHTVDNTDRFHQVIESFISKASDELQEIFRLEQSTNEELNNMIRYFGEDSQQIDASRMFKIFSEFVHKFEKTQQQNILIKHQNTKGI